MSKQLRFSSKGIRACSACFISCFFIPGFVTADPIPETTSVKFFSNGNSSENTSRSSHQRRAYVLNEEGVELVFQGRRDAGEQKIKQALEDDPDNPTAIYNLSGLELANSHTEEALRLINRALELRPDDLAFLNRKAEVYFAASNISDAIRVYEAIIERDPSFGEAMSRLGTLYGMAHDWDRADTTLKRAVEMHPKDVRALSNWGNTLVLKGRFKEAVQILERSQNIKETSGNAVALGIASEGLKDPEQALKHYRKAKELGDQDDELAHHIVALERAQENGTGKKAE